MLDNSLQNLVEYGVECGLLAPEDKIYVTNALLAVFGKNDYAPTQPPVRQPLEDILHDLTEEAARMGLLNADSVTERDLFDTKLMGCMMPRPSEVIDTFWKKYAVSPETATEYYYKLSGDSNYIRRYRIEKDLKWKTATEYGDLDITINLSKPEKDPKAIAAALHSEKSGYPACALCKENEGYAGHLNAAPRQNHRIIPLTLDGEAWFLQYSPYVYYNEHCIVLNGEHTPMKISRGTFRRLLEFTELFPHYFIGSNADLPIVGGSILTHDHFQGGHYTFPMEKADIVKQIHFTGFEDITAGIVKWPMSVIRLNGHTKERLVELADRILTAWRGYTDADAFVFAETEGEKHNTVTPIARRRDGNYELDLVLRNNITTTEHPLGVYHPHAELHHIKKENIGLIEVMGLAVLPARLQKEMAGLKDAVLNGREIAADADLAKHADWVREFLPKYSKINEHTIDEIFRTEIGLVFCKVLEHAGVFKDINAFERFIEVVL